MGWLYLSISILPATFPDRVSFVRAVIVSVGMVPSRRHLRLAARGGSGKLGTGRRDLANAELRDCRASAIFVRSCRSGWELCSPASEKLGCQLRHIVKAGAILVAVEKPG